MAFKIFSEYANKFNTNDIEVAKHAYQWVASSNFVLSKAVPVDLLELKSKQFFLVEARGTAITIVNDGFTVASAIDNIIFDAHAPLRLSPHGFSISGTISYLFGFYLPISI